MWSSVTRDTSTCVRIESVSTSCSIHTRAAVAFVDVYKNNIQCLNIWNVNCIHIYTIFLLKYVFLPFRVRKLQGVIITRSSREISQTIRFDWHSFLSRVRISVRASTFLIGDPPPPQRAQTRVFSLSPATRRISDNLNGDNCGRSGDSLSKKTAKSNKSNRRHRAFIPSRLEQ